MVSPKKYICSMVNVVAACLTGQFRGVCSQYELGFLWDRVLGAFESVDLFAVVPAEDCQKTGSLLPNATRILCIPDRPFTASEEAWLQNGPKQLGSRKIFTTTQVGAPLWATCERTNSGRRKVQVAPAVTSRCPVASLPRSIATGRRRSTNLAALESDFAVAGFC
eukprot:s2564_g7.t1